MDDFHICLKFAVCVCVCVCVCELTGILHNTFFLSQNPGRLPTSPSSVSDIFHTTLEVVSI